MCGNTAEPKEVSRSCISAQGPIASRSDGQMTVQIHPNGELGCPVRLIARVRAGSIDAAPLTNPLLATKLRGAGLPMVGFALAGYEEVWTAQDGRLGTFLQNRFQRHLGLTAMQRIWDFSFRQITTSTKTLNTASDPARSGQASLPANTAWAAGRTLSSLHSC
jgi:TRAP-type C4-dicarboxylate transport system substrate-binding protein